MQATFNQTNNICRTESPKKSEEQVLLRQIAGGDRTAFWQLWQQYQNYLYRRCWTWMTGNYTDAQEALSRAMLKAWNKLPKYAEKITNLKAWLTRMTHNLCVDIHRERQRGAKSIESIDTVADREDEAVISGCDSPESTILRREMKAYIRQAVNALPGRLRQPFILRFDREMSYLEAFQRYAIEIDRNPFLSLSNTSIAKRSFKSKDYNVLIDQVVQLYEGFESVDLDEIKESIANMGKSLLSHQTTEESMNLFAQSTIGISDPGNPQFLIYYTTLRMKNTKNGKSEVLEQEYEVNRTSYFVLPDLIKAHAPTLAKLQKTTVDDWATNSTSPEVEDAKLCFEVKQYSMSR